MLRNTLRSYPKAMLLHGKGGFGVSLGGGDCLYIRSSGQLTAQDLRDLLVLFATWLAVDPRRLLDEPIDELDGVSHLDSEERFLSRGLLD